MGVIILTHWCGFLSLKYYIYDNTKLWNENSNNEPSVETFKKLLMLMTFYLIWSESK